MGYDMTWVRPSDDEDESYFRANITGMGILRDVMETRGMGFWTDHPRFEAEGSEADNEAVRRFHIPGIRGIPLTKFCSNDGWLVTPEEILGALEIHREHPPIQQHDLGDYTIERWEEWIEFLQGATKNGGFRVY
jgi:hypothetical protein